jgi:amino acid efflux transporter
MFGVVLTVNLVGLQLSSILQLIVAALLTGVIAIAVGVALPTRATHNWAPFAPHGWWAVGAAANILIWLFVGWEAVAQLAGEFEQPTRQLPRAMTIAFGVVTVLYIGLAVATVGVTASAASKVPLADLLAVGFGSWGRDATAVLAVALTMATMNVYIGGASKLAAALAESGALPRWLDGESRSIPRRPLVVSLVVGIPLLVALLVGVANADELVRATSACFLTVYVASTASAVRLLQGGPRAAALLSCVLVSGLALFSGWYLLVPAVALASSALIRRRVQRRRLTRSPSSGLG